MKYEDWIRFEEQRLKKKKPLVFRDRLGVAGKPHRPENRVPNQEVLPSSRWHPLINTIRRLWGI